MHTDLLGNSGVIFDIDHYAVHDGPGIRTCIYLKGCYLSCVWCHSPESQNMALQLLFAKSRCISCGACIKACPRNLHHIYNNEHMFTREGCNVCGKCADVCPNG